MLSKVCFFFSPQSFFCSHPQVFYLQTRKSYFASQLWTVTTESWRLVQSLGLKRLESVLRLAEGILHWFGGNVRPRGLKGQSCYWWHGWWVVLTVWGMCEQNSLVRGGLCRLEGVSFIFHSDAVVERIRQGPLPLSVAPSLWAQLQKGSPLLLSPSGVLRLTLKI